MAMTTQNYVNLIPDTSLLESIEPEPEGFVH